MATRKTKMRRDRYEELSGILEDRKLEIMGEVQHKMRDVRTEGAAVSHQGVRDEAESSEAEIQDDIEFALLQMKAETLSKITEALSTARRGHLRLLLRVWRRDRRATAPGATVRRPMQGLRGGPGGRAQSRAGDGWTPRCRFAFRGYDQLKAAHRSVSSHVPTPPLCGVVFFRDQEPRRVGETYHDER